MITGIATFQTVITLLIRANHAIPIRFTTTKKIISAIAIRIPSVDRVPGPVVWDTYQPLPQLKLDMY